MGATAQAFHDKARQLFDLAQVQQLLEWDQEVMMPPRGLDQRAQQVASLASAVHARATDPSFGDLISRLEQDPELDAQERADVREARRAFDRATKVPAQLVEARAEACSLAQAAWEEARAGNDFSLFLPSLARVVSLTRELADAVGGGSRYDALLDEYEPGMTDARLQEVFAALKARLLPLLDAVQGASRKPDKALLVR
ncbi:MAG TPA: hypothetical protein VN436_15675, partial [Holophaga sp.]|nr:hypothetical protein [Holophaga sp.]